MSVNDPIADMLTRIRNACMVRHTTVAMPSSKMKIAMISEHASPLAVLGGVDSRGQNVHVAELSASIARGGHDVTVYTRRDDPDSPE